MSACCCTADDGKQQVELVSVPEIENEEVDLGGEKQGRDPEAAAAVAQPVLSASKPCFVVTLERPDREAPWGLKLDPPEDDSFLFVRNVDGVDHNSPVSAYNASCPKGEQIEVGDYLKPVEGLGAKKLFAQLQESTRTDLLVVHPYVFECKMSMSAGESLGLGVSYSNTGGSLVINAVGQNGIVARTCPQVQVGDRIVRVSNEEGSAEVLMGALKAARGTVAFSFSRPSNFII